MKVLLVRLNYTGFPVPPPDLPLGLLYVAAAIENAGHTVVVRDLNMQQIEDTIYEQIKTGEIGMVGITMLSYVRSSGYALIRIIKSLNKKCVVIVGGIFAQSYPEIFLSRHDVDGLCVGEGEQTIVEAVAAAESGAGLCGIDGLCVRDSAFTPRTLIANLDDIKFPAWRHSNFDWFDMTCATLIPDKVVNGVRLGDARWSPVIASRGCKGRCVFCNAFTHWGNAVRLRSAQNLLDEVETLYHEHGVRLLAFNDDAFPMDKQQCVEFCEGLHERRLQIAWQTTTRADGIDGDLCTVIAAAGCFMVAVGIESGSAAIHRRLRKGINLDKAAEALTCIRESGMISYALLMIGNPGENDDTTTETIEFMNRAKPKYYSYVTGVMVVPGTKLCEMAVAAGQLNNDVWFDDNEDGLPTYTVENSMEQLCDYASRIDKGVTRSL